MKLDLVWLVSESSIDCNNSLNERGLHLQCFGKWEDLSEERGRCSAQNLQETADLVTFTEDYIFWAIAESFQNFVKDSIEWSQSTTICAICLSAFEQTSVIGIILSTSFQNDLSLGEFLFSKKIVSFLNFFLNILGTSNQQGNLLKVKLFNNGTAEI